MTVHPYFAAADVQFRSCAALHDFVDRIVHPVVARAVDRADPLHVTSFAYLHRVATWLRTLSKLNQPSDVQAIDAGARSLFETAIDLTLLRYDLETTPIDMMLDWETSAKFKRCQLRLSVLETMSDDHSKRLAYIARRYVDDNEARVQAARAKWWNSKKGPLHPSRWTGRDLFADAERADKVSKSSELAQHHRLRHADLCWNTHGSAFAAVRGLDEAAIYAGITQSLGDVFRMAREAAEHVVVVLGCYDDGMAAQFGSLDEHRRKVMAGAVPASSIRKHRRTTPSRDGRVTATCVAGALWRTSRAAYSVWKSADARHGTRRRSADLVLVIDPGDGHRVRVQRGDRTIWVDPRDFEDVALPEDRQKAPTSGC